MVLADLVVKHHKEFRIEAWLGYRSDNCGTTGCIAALTVAEFHPHVWEDYQDAFRDLIARGETVPGNGHIQESARELLEITYEEGEKIFHLCSWPTQYYEEHQDAETSLGRAKVAAKYLRSLAK